jgi:hypothetical protein
MPSEALLLGVHVALALGLTILLGVQCSVLGDMRRTESASGSTVWPLSMTSALVAIPVVTVAAAVTGAMLLDAKARGGRDRYRRQVDIFDVALQQDVEIFERTTILKESDGNQYARRCAARDP